EELRLACDPATLPFQSTEELPALDTMIGQERALDATAFGIGVKHPGYNLFVLGPPATGKTTTMQRLLAQTAAGESPAPDYCYVHNFADPYRPRALQLPAGRGRELREEMARLVEECKARLPRAFEDEAFERRRAEILEALGRRQQEEVEGLETAARKHGFAVVRAHGGLAVAPAPMGKPLSPDEFAQLPEASRERISAAAEALDAPLEAAGRRLRELEREAREAHRRLVQEVATAATRELIRELRERFAGLDAVQRHLDEVEGDLVGHADELRAREEPRPALPFAIPREAFLERYRVNVLVDRSSARGAPVVFEPNPTHGNLVGRIEHHVQFGGLVTDFTLIKPGALHLANGGYLLLEADAVLRNFLAWDSLKKALKGRSLRIQEPLEELRLVTAATLAPEPIPLGVKVVLVGTPLLYYLLYSLDEDFR
ncbi:MAG TPA: ATP-binding protein, partial [Methylomirabilota bacterium]|nr:ATP-binding protein [Methylomirabilota bacterium]